MYAIAFDLDTTLLKDAYKNDSWQNAYGEIRKTLMGLGFEWQQGSVCLGKPEVNRKSQLSIVCSPFKHYQRNSLGLRQPFEMCACFGSKK